MMGLKRILFPEEEESSSFQIIRKPAWGDSLAGCADESSFANPAASHRRGKRQRDQQPSKVMSVLMTLDPTHENTNTNTNTNTRRRVRQSTTAKRRTVPVPVDSLGSLGLAVVTSSSGGLSFGGATSSSSSSRRNNKSNSKINTKSKKSNKKKSSKTASKSSQQAKTITRRSKRTWDCVDKTSTTTGLGAFVNLNMDILVVEHNKKTVQLCSSGGLCEFVGLNNQSPTPTSLMTLVMDKENDDGKPQTSTSKASKNNSKLIQKKSFKVKVNAQDQSKATKEPKVTKAKSNVNASKSPPINASANEAENVNARPTTTRKHRMSTRSSPHSHVGGCELEEDADTTAATPSLEPEDVGAIELDDSTTGEPASVKVDNNDDDKDDSQSRPTISTDVYETSQPIGNAKDIIDRAASMEKVVDVPKIIKDQATSTIVTACTPQKKPTTKRKKQRKASPSKTARRRSGRLAKILHDHTEMKESLSKEGCDGTASSTSSDDAPLKASDDAPLKAPEKSAMEVEVISASTDDNCQTSALDSGILPSPTEKKDEEHNSGAARRSRRNVAPPDRFGTYLKDNIADDASGNTVESVQNEELTVQVIASTSTASSQSKQRLPHAKPPKSRPSSKRQTSKLPKRGTRNPTVCISEEEMHADTTDGPETEQRFGEMEWTTDEVTLLRTAHKIIDPKSVSFWQDVSERLEPRSSSECREKWFSLINTPVARPKRKQGAQSGADIAANAVSFEEDDIFNSTPMRTLFSAADSQALQASSGTTGIGCLSHLSFGSAIKVGNANAAVGNGVSTLYSKVGYKTYVKGIRREANRATKTQIHKKTKAGAPGDMPSRKISEKFREGEMAMNGHLSPGGTLKVQKLGGDPPDEDDQFYDEEMEDETHDF